MGIQKPFIVRNGLEVSIDGLVVEQSSLNVGVGTTNPQYDLDVVGDINYTGTLYKNGVPVSFGGTGGGGGDNYWENITVGIYTSTNVYVGGDITLNANTGIISANGLNLNGVLIEGANDRQVSRVIATAGQTTFNINYTVGFVDVFLNGSRLSSVEYTANDGYTVILSTPATEGDEVQLIADRTFTIANIGNASGRNIESFTATAGQTLFVATYTPGFVDVFLNGSRLGESEYVATNGTTVTLVNPASEGDEIAIISFIMVDPNSSGYASKQEKYFVATAGQTTFYATYTIGYVDVYLNGAKLTKTEYSATDGQTVILTTPATLGDELEIISFQLVDPNVLNPASRSIYYFSAGAAQTTFTVNYTVGYVDVYLNGAKLTPSEFTATDGANIILTTPATEGDDIEIVSFIMVDPALGNFWGQTSAGIHTLSYVGIGTTNPTAALTVNGNVIISGIITAGTFVGDGSGLTNVSADSYWIQNGNGITTSSYIGIGTDNPTSALTVNGDILVSGVVTATAFYGDGSGLTNVPSDSYWVSTGAGIHTLSNVGIGTTNPTTKLEIFGNLSFSGNNITIGEPTVGENLDPYNPFLSVVIQKVVWTGATTLIGEANNTYNLPGLSGNKNGTNAIAYISRNSNGDISTIIVDDTQNNFAYQEQIFVLGSLIGGTDGVDDLTIIIEEIYKEGTGNIFMGTGSGRHTTSGGSNNFIGEFTGYCNITGSENNFFGYGSGKNNTTAFRNNFIGSYSGYNNTGGCYNNFLGHESGCCNTTGSYNVAIGAYTYGPTTGVGNFLGGYAAGYSGMTDSSYNNFIGWYAGGDGDQGYSCYNNFLGYCAGGYNSDGGCNNFIGSYSGYNNSGAYNNNFFGTCAGFFNSGDHNNFVGSNAGWSNSTGSYNNFFGYSPGRYNTTGSWNVFFGQCAGYYNTIGYSNNFIGHCAGVYNTTGSYNNFFGSYTGISTSSTNKVIIGRGHNNVNLFDSPDTTKDTQLAIGIRTFTTPANYWIVGDENFNIGLGVTAPTSKLHVGGGINIGTASTVTIGDGDLGSSGGPDSMFGIYNVSAGGTISLNTYDQSSVLNETLVLKSGYATFNSNVGIKTANPTSDLHVLGDAKITGILTVGSSSITINGNNDSINVGSAITITGSSGFVTATAFVGDGSRLTNLPPQFPSRVAISSVTESMINLNTVNLQMEAFKTYIISSIFVSQPARVRLYTDNTSRATDAGRGVGTDPDPGSGLILEVVSTSTNFTQKVTPFVVGGNLDNPASNTAYFSITNQSGSTTSIGITVTFLRLEL